jgi:hypothetical protein
MRAHEWDEIEKMLNETPGLVNYVDETVQITMSTPLFLAVSLCLEDKCGVENVDFLLRRGADPNKASLFNGRDCLPIFHCTTVPKHKCGIALQLATMLIAQGLDINAFELLPMTLARMSAFPDDYDATMIRFLCRQGICMRLHNGIGLLVRLQFQWAYEIVDCLLNEGAYIYTYDNIHNGILDNHMTPCAGLVKKADQLRTYAKNLRHFERAIHLDDRLDVYSNQWKEYIPDFNKVVRTVLKDERKGYLALKNASSTAYQLPDDVFLPIMSFITSKKGVLRARAWV